MAGLLPATPDTTECGKTRQNGSLFDRADRLLATFTHRLGVHHCWPLAWRHESAKRRISSVCAAAALDGSYADVGEDTSYPCENTEARDMPTVLLLEHRDDVHSLLSAGLAAGGIQTIRATNSAQAIRQYVGRPTDVLIVNGDQPNESAWLLAAKLHLTHLAARIWVYKRRISACDVAAANFLTIDGLVDYDGSVCRLAAVLHARRAKLPGQARRLSDKGHGPDQAVA